MVLYNGIFITLDELQKAANLRTYPLEREITNPHVTCEFRPKNPQTELFGTEAEVTITGYGCDGNNEGFSVSVKTANPEVQALIDKVPVPHITLSVSAKGRPVDTAHLKFTPCEHVVLHGIFAGYDPNQN